MSKSQKLEAILDEARQREKEYDWTAAAEFYKKGVDVTLESNELLKAGELYEKIGFCYRRATYKKPQNSAERYAMIIFPAY
jgi:hypothetical protein